MDCQEFDRRLDALLDGTCSPESWQEAEAHQDGCARCRQLFEALAGRGDELAEPEAASFAAGILARTSGSTCESAHERLCDYVDGALERVDRELVAAHLAHCDACTELAHAIERCTAALPAFAEIVPPAGFAADVLRATSWRPEPSAAPRRAAWVMPEWLVRLAARPRFAFEVAYVCTVLLVVLVGNPVKAFKDAAASTVPYVRPKVEAVAQRVGPPIARARELRDETAAAIAASRQRAQERRSSWETGITAAQGWWEQTVVQTTRSWMSVAWQWTESAYAAVSRAVQELFGGRETKS